MEWRWPCVVAHVRCVRAMCVVRACIKVVRACIKLYAPLKIAIWQALISILPRTSPHTSSHTSPPHKPLHTTHLPTPRLPPCTSNSYPTIERILGQLVIEDGGGGAEAVQRAQGKIYEALCQQSVELVREPIMLYTLYITIYLQQVYTCITLFTPMYTRYTCIYTILIHLTHL